MGKILAIADALTLEVLQEFLSGEGHQVIVAPDAQSGLDLAEQTSPDLVICDGTSPQIEWLDLYRMQADNSEFGTIYLILLAASDQFDSTKLDVLVDDFVLKPIVKQELLGRVRGGFRSRQLRAQLERSHQELQQFHHRIIENEKTSNLGELVSGIAHEINNPITFIYSNLTHIQTYATDLIELLRMYQEQLINPSQEILQKQQDMDVEFLLDDFLKIVSSMRTGSDRIRQIILSVQEFSRSDRSGWQLFDVSDGLENTLLLLQHRLPAREGRRDIKVVKDYGNLPQIECYAGQLNQAFLNIMNYAIDALEESSQQLNESEAINFKPVIWIRTQVVSGQRIAIEIADNGIAMSEEVKTKIFERFFITKPAMDASTIGLAISYDIIVEQHKGELKYFSQAGKGTQFRIELPQRHS
ncbi:MAG: hybrid sensor histidine kinase/response regulator [Oscillatoriales cyanobacterium]|uniref:histidine kinase n=1 Tax=Microcoleus anatoxicus PTRS2 TaxID=2705321 RepID=A0ABU8YGL3_9CYAN|nr:MAG: hybrid sensor histidine kinase/response regulator [Oscillatoriales cyanobacterium]TAD92846.1 MAG: hybrid sensor histidine kinase/response regulator [Oscillatoriales cyanobacterium]TAE06777.1 MAG: hybrid sensor histidine kinase/response regulator [Oscillatoriales cyanobacterium]TAF05666.1 MAG: hybrid sensor histidine kinase/response regulator [Oscillatoriales cyanobacterium]TAF44453.1 MAG: hybrid sensor histidine kinase/response regulator [Oscillatoriales cyanobacterium]